MRALYLSRLRWRPAFGVAALVAFALACGASASSQDGGALSDAGTASQDGGATPGDAGLFMDAGVDKAAACASTFGTTLTNAFGRVDGTVHAVVPPAHPTCALPNGTHLVLQLDVMGATYRLVVNVQSDRAGQDPKVSLAEVRHALPGRAWQEGWWPGEALDYVTTLGAHSGDFTAYEMAPLVARVTERLAVGAAVSVYATSSGGGSAHLVHRNASGRDGAIVIDPSSANPLLLLFRFADQTF